MDLIIIHIVNELYALSSEPVYELLWRRGLYLLPLLDLPQGQVHSSCLDLLLKICCGEIIRMDKLYETINFALIWKCYKLATMH